MRRHRALLIGAGDYDDPAIPPLPFVREDLQRLASVLGERGFQTVEVPEARRGVTPNFVGGQVGRFLRDAKAGDTLLVLLSGHGGHFEGHDYLVPEDASFDVEPFAGSCVRIDWRKELEESEAAQVVFLIDACREGFERGDTMRSPGPAGWSDAKIHAALERKVAYVYACSTAQVALFVGPDEAVAEGVEVGTVPQESFSLFSRAVSDVVSGRPYALALAEFEEAVQQRIGQLHAAYRKSRPVQRVRVVTDIDKRGFTVFPGPVRDACRHPWLRAVAGHPAWERVDPELSAARELLKEESLALAERLAAAYESAAAALAGDPWHHGRLALRAHERAEFLTGKLGKDARLSPTEAALLALLPFVSQAFWAQEAARRIGALAGYPADRTPEGDAFHTFVRGHPRLDRRLRRLRQTGAGTDSARRILWWLFHRWLLQQPDVYAPQSLKELLEPPAADPERPAWIREALSGERLARFVKDQRTSPFTTPRAGELADQEQLAATTLHEHEVREPLVSCLAKTAHALAVDPVDLPEVIAEHLGISDSVDLAELHTTLDASRWTGSGAGRALTAVCGHPAVEIALQTHAQRVDALLRDINQAAAKAGHTLAPLAQLPPYANAGGVRPSGHTPANLSSGIRFHLAEDRVQELLMGEELYGDRGLAVRELYQNALDACRYREARTAYLERTGQRPARWTGLIEFVQGTDAAGRPYLECRDNGIGMGVSELSRTFSQGGARFVDLPEYVEEAADWAQLDPPVRLHPNSRFGIGVLSYFMLADEITVHTCRLGRDGRPGRLLKVTIAGPGNLFRIEDVGPGEWAGTHVRLHLTARAARRSALDQLAEVLWVAQYRVRVTHGSRTSEWEPGVLREDLAAAYSGSPGGPMRKLGRCFPSSHPDLWWTESNGMLLSDGLRAGDDPSSRAYPYGVIVNLHGPHRPELSVDRRRLLGYDAEYVRRIMRQALPSFAEVARRVLSRAWLQGMSRHLLSFADESLERAAAVGGTLSIAGEEVPLADLGYFPPDTLVLSGIYGRFPTQRDSRLLYLGLFPEPVLRWRLRALLAKGLGGPTGPGFPGPPALPMARPSDLHLLSEDCFDSVRSWELIGGGHYRLHMYLDGDALHLADFLGSLVNTYRWRSPAAELTVGEVFSRVQATGYPASQVVGRLGELGYRTPDLRGAGAATAEDMALLRSIGARGGWLEPGAVLGVPQISVSAARAGRSPAEAATRLADLGYQVPRHPYRDTPWSPEDAALLLGLWDREYAQYGPGPVEEPRLISTARIVTVAFRTSRSHASVIRLLGEAGFTPAAEAARLGPLRDDDTVLLSEGFPVDRPVPRGALVAIAQHLGRSVADVAARLAELGFQPPDRLPADDALRAEDAELVKQLTSHLYGWPAEDRPVDIFTLASVAGGPRRLPDVADWFEGLGYQVALDRELLAAVLPRELSALRRVGREGVHLFAVVPPELLLAAARATGRPLTAVARKLARLGLTIEPVPEELAAEYAMESLLSQVLDPAHPLDLESARARADLGPVSLRALLTVATRHGTTFREAARLATEIGMAHEAAEWFPEPERPAELDGGRTPSVGAPDGDALPAG
ncbi:HD domain-containing protein [Streptomyces palmae]|uniref:Peptidase C14 caspase catalytic subunit p20 n=1 Tax=Streptomyces palmae TaxID=1701085 RepID=A0A4Z0HAI3_9ACTN|nr:caspase family protein [Streptomyces palmae]TGB10221.1 hypothetical protein E4099_13010 [Streptomyces palmae]